MNSFRRGVLEKVPSDHDFLRTFGGLREFRGRETLFGQQTPQILETLRQAAIKQSAESSNRIEGVVAPAKRLQQIVLQKKAPRNRPEAEIAGYRDVLATIHASHADIPFTPGIVLQFHRDLYRYTDVKGGRWKTVDNDIREVHPNGREVIRFKPVSAFRTAGMMKDLHSQLEQEWKRGHVDNLILIPAYILDFLCIHPFLDGNGRMSRLLTLMLLYRAGYGVGRYISLERIIEESRETYYEALQASSARWHQGRHDIRPWVSYLLGTFLAAYREFEERAGTLMSSRGAKTRLAEAAIEHLPVTFRMTDLEQMCPNVTRGMIRVVLRRMKSAGTLATEGAGRGAFWRKK